MGKASRIARRKRAKKKAAEPPFGSVEGTLAWLVLKTIRERPGITEDAIVSFVRDAPEQIYDGPRDDDSIYACLAALEKHSKLRTRPPEED